MPFISIASLTAPYKNFSTTLHHSESKYPCLFPSRESISFFTIKCAITVGYPQSPYIWMRRFSSMSSLLRILWMPVEFSKIQLLPLLKYLSDFFLSSVNVVNYIDRFSNVGPTLHSWINCTYSWCNILFIHCWILFANILLVIFACMFIRNFYSLLFLERLC